MARGVSFGRYVIVKRLAVGAMSEVFLAEQTDTAGDDRWVALKRMRPEALLDEAQAEAFLREAELLQQLSHPYLVRVRASGREEGLPYIALEYVHGITLEALLAARRRRGEAPLPWPAVARIAAHVCECLLYLGGLETLEGTPLGLVHRDIHPGNIMLSQSGCTRLLDFGIARASGRSPDAAPGRIHARLEYAAPEQLRGMATDERTDVHGLALTVYELLTGTQPFVRRTPAETAQAVASDRPPRLTRLRREVPAA
ncbi:MAG: serine/threonine-protein kinase, partial [Myxococcaceae bacterium]